MNQTLIIDMASKAMYLVLILSMPPIIVATIVGLLISLLQALTQIQEQTLGIAMKLIAVAIALALMSHWMGEELVNYSKYIFEAFPQLVK